ncbi:MAG: GNAT family N-acetyltransferase [bacterium]|nr:GNAT family N-acetyltransferase [bacterium]
MENLLTLLTVIKREEMMNITITQLQSQDVTIAQETVAQFWEHRPNIESIARFLNDRHNILVMASCGDVSVGQLIGYLLERWDGKPPMLLLYSIDVLEPYRRQGIGRALLQHIREIGQKEGCSEMFLITNASNVPAMQLYQKTGGQRPFYDDVMFEYDLTHPDAGVSNRGNDDKSGHGLNPLMGTQNAL